MGPALIQILLPQVEAVHQSWFGLLSVARNDPTAFSRRIALEIQSKIHVLDQILLSFREGRAHDYWIKGDDPKELLRHLKLDFRFTERKWKRYLTLQKRQAEMKGS